MTVNLRCACGGFRTIYFDHVRGTVSAACQRCATVEQA